VTIPGIGRVDHVAIGVEDLDAQVAFFTGKMGMVEGRRGVYLGEGGGRIGFVADPVTGLKFELIEAASGERGLMHIAWRVDSVPQAHDHALGAGLRPLREPRRLEPGKADTRMVEAGGGLCIQFIRYDEGSPDLLDPGL